MQQQADEVRPPVLRLVGKPASRQAGQDSAARPGYSHPERNSRRPNSAFAEAGIRGLMNSCDTGFV